MKHFFFDLEANYGTSLPSLLPFGLRGRDVFGERRRAATCFEDAGVKRQGADALEAWTESIESERVLGRGTGRG